MEKNTGHKILHGSRTLVCPLKPDNIMKAKTSKANGLIYKALAKDQSILEKIFNIEQIWYPEWEHFKIIKINNLLFFLFEKNEAVFHSSCYEVVKTVLIERFHFFERSRRQAHLNDLSRELA